MRRLIVHHSDLLPYCSQIIVCQWILSRCLWSFWRWSRTLSDKPFPLFFVEWCSGSRWLKTQYSSVETTELHLWWLVTFVDFSVFYQDFIFHISWTARFVLQICVVFLLDFFPLCIHKPSFFIEHFHKVDVIFDWRCDRPERRQRRLRNKIFCFFSHL